MVAEKTANKQRVIGRPFQKGQSGNPAGRPKGSRAKYGEEFYQTIAAHVAEHGTAALDRLLDESVVLYFNLLARVLPQELNVNTKQDLTFKSDDLSETDRWLAGLVAEQEGGKRKKLGKKGPLLPH